MIRPSDPPPIREDEAVAFCRNCGDDAWHRISIGQYGAVKECDECGEIADYEGAA